MNFTIDLHTVLTAVLGSIVGYLWYSKWLFGPMYCKMGHKGAKEHCNCKTSMAYSFIVTLVTAFVLSGFIARGGVVTDGMYMGFILWIGFVATTQISPVIWADRPVKMFLLSTGCKLVQYLVMGGFLAS